MHQKFTTVITILFLVSSGVACSLLKPKPRLTWHILLEINSATPEREAAMKRAARVIQQRLDAFGVSHFEVLPQGTPLNGRILVNLPDLPDRDRLTKVITAEGLLELSAVVSPPSPELVKTYNTEQEAQASLGGIVPANRRVLPYLERGESANGAPGPRRAGQWVVVEAPAIVDGRDLRDATARHGSTDDYQIGFSLGPEGAEKFGAWTGAHINNYLGVVLNGEVKSIAFIKSRIYDQGEIAGRFTKQSAEDLALVLRSGAMPGPVKIIEETDSK